MADRKKILDYLGATVKEYAVGVDLIAEFGSQTMAASYRNASPRFMMPQVLALLRRLANAPSSQVKKSNPTIVSSGVNQPAIVSGGSRPKVISDAKALLHQLYLSMVDYHNRLLAMGDDNRTEICQQRVQLMKERQPYVEHFVELDDLVRDYFATDTVPSRLSELVSILNSHPVEELPSSDADKLSSFSDLDLAKEYKRTKSNINRRQNKLRFQSPTSKPELNPMPDGPLRKQVEAELAQLKVYIKAIMAEQQKRGLIK